MLSMLYNINRGKSAPKSMYDFMLDFGKPEPKSDEGMRSILRIAAEGLPRKEDSD